MAAEAADSLSLRDFVRQNPSKRGLAIIVTNDYLHTDLTPLVGTKKDGERMRIAFSRLDIANIWKENVTKYQLQQLLKEVEQLSSCPASYDSISFVFSGHGASNNLVLQDMCDIHIQEVINAFSPNMAPNIADIPKLLFIDACRGSEEIRPVRVPARPRESLERYEVQPQPRTYLTSQEANCLIAYSTLVPYQAYEREKGNGSEWMQILADTMCKSTDHIEDVLTQVRKDLHAAYNKSAPSKDMQMPETRSTLLRKVYLNRVARRAPAVSRRTTERPYMAHSRSHFMGVSQSSFMFMSSMGTFTQRDEFLFRF